MLGYYFQLAFRNLRRNPGLTALMIGAVALGQGADKAAVRAKVAESFARRKARRGGV